MQRPGGTGGTWLVLAVAGCCGNPGGTEVPVDARIDARVDYQRGWHCCRLCFYPLGGIGYNRFRDQSAGLRGWCSFCSFILVGCESDVSSSGTEVPGGLVPDSGRVVPAKGWESLDGQSALLDLVRIVGI